MAFRNIHPGELIAEQIEGSGGTPGLLAAKLGMDPGELAAIIAGRRPVTPEIALRLARFFGNTAELWMAVQVKFDLAAARRTHAARIAREVETA